MVYISAIYTLQLLSLWTTNISYVIFATDPYKTKENLFESFLRLEEWENTTSHLFVVQIIRSLIKSMLVLSIQSYASWII